MKTLEATITIKAIENDGKLYLQTGDGEVVSIVRVERDKCDLKQILEAFVPLVIEHGTEAARSLRLALTNPVAAKMAGI